MAVLLGPAADAALAFGRRLVWKLFEKRPSALHGAAGSLARREKAGAYARWARLPTALSPVLKQLLSRRRYGDDKQTRPCQPRLNGGWRT